MSNDAKGQARPTLESVLKDTLCLQEKVDGVKRRIRSLHGRLDPGIQERKDGKEESRAGFAQPLLEMNSLHEEISSDLDEIGNSISQVEQWLGFRLGFEESGGGEREC